MKDLTPARHAAARRTYHGLRAGAALFAAVAAAGFTMLATGVANAAPAPAPRLVEGNVASCEQAELEGSIILGGGDTSGSASSEAGTGTVTDGLTLDVTLNAGFTATGIVVKGGTDANVYDGPFVGPTEVEGMIAPLTGGGQQAEISHWFVCGFETPPTTPPTTPPPGENGDDGEDGENGEGGDDGEDDNGSLPVTGMQVGGLVALGAGLLAAGIVMLAVRRRRDLPGLTDG
jgi:LPXTG-motif cell wall-anchored protein